MWNYTIYFDRSFNGREAILVFYGNQERKNYLFVSWGRKLNRGEKKKRKKPGPPIKGPLIEESSITLWHLKALFQVLGIM